MLKHKQEFMRNAARLNVRKTAVFSIRACVSFPRYMAKTLFEFESILALLSEVFAVFTFRTIFYAVFFRFTRSISAI